MIKLFMLLSSLIALGACGNQELPTDTPTQVGNNVELRQLSSLSASEKLTLKDLCLSLAQKENNFLQFYADKGIRFQFETNQKKCGQSQGIRYLVSAQVEHQGGKMVFVKQSPNVVMFSDILLRNSGMLKNICDASEAQGGVDERYFESQNRAQIIYLKRQASQIELMIDHAQKIDRTTFYQVLAKDFFLIETSNSLYQGIVSKRVQSSSVACPQGQSGEVSSILKKIN